MNDTNVAGAGLKDLPGNEPDSVDGVRRLRQLGAVLGVLALCFSGILLDLGRLAWKEEFHSHILLVPFIAVYLMRQTAGPAVRFGESWRLPAVILGALGFAALAAHGFLRWRGWIVSGPDALVLPMLALVLFGYGAVCYFLGRPFVQLQAFPLAFLLFMVPVPTAVEHSLAVVLQYASADASAWLIHLSGTPMLREGLIFRIPGTAIEVAEECSGVRSSFVLFITSMIAGWLYLRGWVSRLILVAVVLPLGIARNAVRIFTIAMLVAHVDATLIDSWVHERGGPIFFVLSLFPFLGIIWWLRRREMKSNPPSP